MTEPVDFATNWVFARADAAADPFGPVGVIDDIPDGLGPLIGSVVDDGSGHVEPSGARVASGSAEFSMSSVFRLTESDATSTLAGGLEGTALPVAAIRQLGSASLAAALASANMADVLEALADDVVLVPVIPSADGRLQTRLFGTVGGAGDLCLFSSAATMERFLGEDSGAYFLLQHGAAVVAFLSGHAGAVADVVFDPAGPNSLRVPSSTIVGFLEFEPVDLEALEALTESTETVAEVTGFRLNLDAQWGRIDLPDPVRRDEQIKTLVAAQTRTLDDRAAQVRLDMRSWLSRAAEKAASADGTRMYFLLTATKNAAAALSVVSYFHDFGQPTSMSHIDQVTDYLLTKAGPADELFRIDGTGEPMLRHSRPVRGNQELGGGDVTLWDIDYWIPAPDGRHVAHVSFSTPHLEVKDTITQLCDNVVFNGEWVIPDDSAPDGATEVIGGNHVVSSV